MQRFLVGLLLVWLMAGMSGSQVQAQGNITIDDRGVQIEFPDRVTFKARLASEATIERVVLEYGVQQLTCGDVVAKAFPVFDPATSVDVEWTWEMRESGSQPPGSTIWYRWRVTDANGNEQVSDQQQVVWLDDTHYWETVERDQVRLHWYDGSSQFANELLTSATASLAQLRTTTGVAPEAPIDLYIYGDTAHMRDAVLYEPGWTGGLAFPEQSIVLIGVSPEQIAWGKDTVAHELTHVLVGHLTFSCIGRVPTWLNEGIAVYGEGGLDPASEAGLDAAIASNSLIGLRALNGGFSEHPDKADLSYAQSYSLVNYLISSGGQARLLALFGGLRDGQTVEAALQAAYGFGLDGLEQRWRSAIGAAPPRAAEAEATTAQSPTPVPTYQPLNGAPVVETGASASEMATSTTEGATASNAPTSTVEAATPEPTATSAPAASPTVDAAPQTQTTPPTAEASQSKLVPIAVIAVCVIGLLAYSLFFIRKLFV